MRARSAHLREGRIERRLQRAKFRDAATLESFDWKFNEKSIDQIQFQELATGEFIRRRDNLVFVGESGLGKSHLIQSVGRCCCALGYRVRYVTSAKLLEELTAASGDKTLPTRVRYYSRIDLLIIDEFGFDKLERREYPESSSLLYKVIDSRSRKGSTAWLRTSTSRTGPITLAICHWPWHWWIGLSMARSFSGSKESPIQRIERNNRLPATSSVGNQHDLWVHISGLSLYPATLDLCRKLDIEPLALELKIRNHETAPDPTTNHATTHPPSQTAKLVRGRQGEMEQHKKSPVNST